MHVFANYPRSQSLAKQISAHLTYLTRLTYLTLFPDSPYLHFARIALDVVSGTKPALNRAGLSSMELYYKDLISEDASLDKLVDDLMLVVQGASEIAEAAGSHLDPEQNAAIRSKIQAIKEGCNQIKDHAMSGMRATDKLLRRYPYSSIGFAFGLGILTALTFQRGRK